MRSSLVSLVLVAACASKSPQKDQGSGATPPPPPPPADAAEAAPPIDAAVVMAKRPTPKPLMKDKDRARPIDGPTFTTLLNPRANGKTIHASEDGGCQIYVRDPNAPIGPPGSFPPPTPIACPPEMLKPEWGYCVGPNTVHTDGKDCICQLGAGDPPGPPFRMPCPK